DPLAQSRRCKEHGDLPHQRRQARRNLQPRDRPERPSLLAGHGFLRMTGAIVIALFIVATMIAVVYVDERERRARGIVVLPEVEGPPDITEHVGGLPPPKRGHCPRCGWLIRADELHRITPVEGWKLCGNCNGDGCTACAYRGTVREL